MFPIISSSPKGLPRLAADARKAGEGHQIEFRSMKVRSILSRVVSKRQLLLDYSINPYRGCEFGCKYCYARYTHEFLAGKEAGPTHCLSAPESFERVIFLKENAGWLLEQELRRIDRDSFIAIGTATDPYQPIERRACVTRSILEVFSRTSGYRLGIVTKSNLITRDVDLLEKIASANSLSVHLTITTPDAQLARKLEPRAPRPELRFAAVRRLREHGIRVGVFCSPLMPDINDTATHIDDMVRRSADAGAMYFAANPLFLKPCSRQTYFDFLRASMPPLLPDYEERFRTAEFAPATYRNELQAKVRDACRRFGLVNHMDDEPVMLQKGKQSVSREDSDRQLPLNLARRA